MSANRANPAKGQTLDYNYKVNRTFQIELGNVSLQEDIDLRSWIVRGFFDRHPDTFPA